MPEDYELAYGFHAEAIFDPDMPDWKPNYGSDSATWNHLEPDWTIADKIDKAFPLGE